MTPSTPELDGATRVLVQLGAAVAASDEPTIRYWLGEAAREVPPVLVEELLLQSFLFCGFPRALNAMREWRRVSQRLAPDSDEAESVDLAEEWRARGERTCAMVYGSMYDRLRLNVRDLHPALDSWMVVDGYGKVLGRPGLDLQRRELCIVAACAAMGQDRQLHSHLRGALNVGVDPSALRATLEAIGGLIGAERVRLAHLLLARVVGK